MNQEATKSDERIWPGSRVRFVAGEYEGYTGTFVKMVSPLRCLVTINHKGVRSTVGCHLRELEKSEGGSR